MTRVRKISGIKRHIAVDAQGLPHAIADATDRAGRLGVFTLNHQGSLSAMTNVLVDNG